MGSHGVPIGLAVAGANRRNLKMVPDTLASIVVKRPKPTMKKQQNMCLDKAYHYEKV